MLLRFITIAIAATLCFAQSTESPEIRDLTERIRTTPTAALYASRALEYMKRDLPTLAVDDYSQAIRLRLDEPKYWIARASARAALNRFSEAIDDLDQASRLAPDSTAVWMDRGFYYGQLGDFAHATQDLSRVLKAEPKNLRALTLRGAAYAKMGDYSRGLTDFTAAINLEPKQAPLYMARADIYVAMGNHGRALLDRSEAIRLQPNSPEYYVIRGGSYHELGRHSEGIADRSTAITLRPDWAEAWFARGSAYFLMGDYSNATADLMEATRLAPNYADAVNLRDRATQELAKAQLPSAEPEHPAESAQIMQSAGKSMMVLAKVAPEPLQTKQLETPPAKLEAPADPSEEHHQKGRDLLAKHKYKEAVDELNAALSLNPSFPQALNARGYVYFLLRDYAKALKDFDEAIRLNPAYANAYQNRAATRKRAGNVPGAADDLLQVQALLK